MKISNIPQRKFCIIENWEFENVNEHVWKSCILDIRWTSRGIEPLIPEVFFVLVEGCTKKGQETEGKICLKNVKMEIICGNGEVI